MRGQRTEYRIQRQNQSNVTNERKKIEGQTQPQQKKTERKIQQQQKNTKKVEGDQQKQHKTKQIQLTTLLTPQIESNKRQEAADLRGKKKEKKEQQRRRYEIADKIWLEESRQKNKEKENQPRKEIEDKRPQKIFNAKKEEREKAAMERHRLERLDRKIEIENQEIVKKKSKQQEKTSKRIQQHYMEYREYCKLTTKIHQYKKSSILQQNSRYKQSHPWQRKEIPVAGKDLNQVIQREKCNYYAIKEHATHQQCKQQKTQDSTQTIIMQQKVPLASKITSGSQLE